jgi:hypothetical protein
MRWLFCETDEERARRDQVLAAIDAWWAAFREREPEIRRHIALESKVDLPAFVAEGLRAISPELAWEFGPGSGDGHRLTITAEERYHLHPLAAEVVRRAPALPGWELRDHRPPWPAPWVQRTIEARTQHPFGGWHVIVSQTSVGHKVQLRFLIPDCKRSEDPEFLGRALVVAEVLLGEEVTREWVGPILVDPLPRQRAYVLFGKVTVGALGSVEVEQMEARVRAEIETIRAALPEAPRCRLPPRDEYFMYEEKPEPALDYAGQDDLYVSTGDVPGLYQGVRVGAFASATFSRAGETFCYVKLDGSAGLEGSAFADRGELEEALDEKLIAMGLGCRVGGGSGLRYSYIELALLELPKAVEVVREVMRAGRVPQRCWLLFHDAVLTSEWLGLYPETPPPPNGEPGDPPQVRPNRIQANLKVANDPG